MERRELVIVGAGPAGMSAAMTAKANGVDVVVLDEAPSPGGQIYRGVEAPGLATPHALGEDHADGAALVGAFRQSGVDYRPGSTVWEIDPQRVVRISGGAGVRAMQAGRVLIATGALERPFPIPGWTLPGVMSAGGAQVLLKSAGLVPDSEVVLAGTGPLLLLLATQYLALGVPLAAVLETTPPDNRWRALPHLPAALASGSELGKGISLLRALRRSGVRHLRGVNGLQALGGDALERVEFRAGGRQGQIPARQLLLHQGVVPELALARSSGCELDWDRRQLCFRPRVDRFGNSTVDGVSVVGDGAGIAGARAARSAGALAGLEAAHGLGHIDRVERERQGRVADAERRRAVRIRPLLEILYRPPDAQRVPESDEVVVCRCEDVRAGTVRAQVARGAPDPNAVKSRTRCGMGPCQGRYCGLTVTEIIAASRDRSPQDVGYFRLRSPVKPVPLEDILALDTGAIPREVTLPDPMATGSQDP